MKQIPFQYLSITGLALTVASAITAAVLPENEDKKQNYGRLQLSSDGGLNTCVIQSGFNQCTYTVTLPDGCVHPGIGSRTSTFNGTGQNDSSSITLTASDCETVNSITEGTNNVPRKTLHTSADDES